MNFLVTAIGSMAGEAVISRLLVLPDTHVTGCNMHPAEWCAASRLVHSFYKLPLARQKEIYIEKLMTVCETNGIDYIIPLTDIEVDVLSEYRNLFSSKNIIPCISEGPSIKIARNKLTVHDLFRRHPHISVIPTSELDAISTNPAFPALAKPAQGRSSEGHIDIPDIQSWNFWHPRLKGKDYIVQKKYTGDIFVVDIVRAPDGKSVAITRQELLRTPNGAGMTVKVYAHHPCNRLAIQVSNLLELTGCVNMEFLSCEGKIMLMDINPRFSAGVAFSILSGYDMVANHVKCFSGQEIDDCDLISEKIYTRGFKEYASIGG